MNLTKNNEKKIQDFLKFMQNVLMGGFYGKFLVEFIIEDGSIQEYETKIVKKHR